MRNVLWIVMLAAVVLFAVGCKEKTEPAAPAALEKPVQDAQQTVEQTAVEQTTCPILPANPIDKNIFVEYKGKKVYFCCQGCVAKFNAEPEKYVKDLPQFKQP